MEWTVRYFLYQSHIWLDRKRVAEGMDDSGAAAYAARKMGMWKEMANRAAKLFLDNNPGLRLPKS